MVRKQIKNIFEVLLIEDNPGDSRLFEDVFLSSNSIHNLYILSDGKKAYDFLNKTGDYEKAPTPDIILLDLSLPNLDGLHLLQFIKTQAGLKRIPVIVLTISENEKDILRAYNAHANCFITKPSNLDDFIKVVHGIQKFWLDVVLLPHG